MARLGWQSIRFFSMPIEHKKKAAHPSRPNPHRGWSSVGQEKLSMIRQGKTVLDLKVSPREAHAMRLGHPSAYCLLRGQPRNAIGGAGS